MGNAFLGSPADRKNTPPSEPPGSADRGNNKHLKSPGRGVGPGDTQFCTLIVIYVCRRKVGFK